MKVWDCHRPWGAWSGSRVPRRLPAVAPDQVRARDATGQPRAGVDVLRGGPPSGRRTLPLRREIATERDH